MRKILLWTVVGLAAIAILLVGVTVFQERLHENQQKKLATTFVQDVLSGNANGSYDLFSSSAQDTQTSDDWSAQVDKLSSFFKGQNASFDKINITKTSTEVDYRISGKDGDYVFAVTLVSSKAGWRVQSFTSLLSLQ